MSAKPYTAEELAELRMGASEGLAGLTVSRALATLDAVAAERDEARAENMAIRVRVTRAHEAVYRAMFLPAEEALAALQDEGSVHRAIHDIFCGPEGTAAYPLDKALRAHVDGLERRSLAAEQERDQARRERDELREAARALLDILTAREGGRQCNDCYALATVADPLPGGKMAPAFERDPQAAVEKALARAASIRMPGVTPDGAPYPHPQDPSGGRERVEP